MLFIFIYVIIYISVNYDPFIHVIPFLIVSNKSLKVIIFVPRLVPYNQMINPLINSLLRATWNGDQDVCILQFIKLYQLLCVRGKRNHLGNSNVKKKNSVTFNVAYSLLAD